MEDDYGLFKCYIVSYLCASARGIALELVPDTSSKYFVHYFQKFIARRGCPGELLSDNEQFPHLKDLKDLLQTKTLAGNLA